MAAVILAQRPRLRVLFIAAAIVALTLLIYVPSWRNDFVLDDDLLIYHNDNVTRPDGLYRSWCTTQQLDYWPLTYSAFWLEWRLFGRVARGYHAVSAGLHLLGALLLWRLLLRLELPGAGLAALIFAVHPVNVEAVAWASQQKTLIALPFYLLALWAYLRFDDTGRRRWYALALMLLLLARLSKTAAVMLPVTILACCWWRYRRLRGQDLWRSLPFFLLAAGLGALSVWFQSHRVMGETLARSDGLPARLAGAGRALGFYLGQAWFPADLAVVYPSARIDPGRAGDWLPLALVGISALVLFRFRHGWGRAPWFAGVVYSASLLPFLGLVDIHFMIISLFSDRYQYFALPAAIALVTGVGHRLVERAPRALRVSAYALTAFTVLLLAGQARAHTQVFRDRETHFRSAVAAHPQGVLPWFMLGSALEEQGRREASEQCFERGLGAIRERLQAGGVQAHEHLLFATIFLAQDDRDQARAHCRAALQLQPTAAKAHFLLGQAFEQEQRSPEAIAAYREAIRIRPQYRDAHGALGELLLRLGDRPAAIESFRALVAIQPYDFRVHGLLGDLLADAGQAQEAARHYRRVLELEPASTEARRKLEALEQP